MKILDVISLLTVIVSLVLVIMYTGTLVAICKGVRHYKVVIMTVLLLMSNLMGLLVPFIE